MAAARASCDTTSETALAGAVARGEVELGVDGVALVQESAPLRDGHIIRVETLGGKYLYAIKVYPAVGSFDLCPADACQTTNGVELVRAACAVDAVKTGLRVEGYTPPAEIIEQVEAISRRAGLDIGGIEYLVDDRDGKHYFYDINALSNFVADAENVVGFDPWTNFVDYLERAEPARRLPRASCTPIAAAPRPHRAAMRFGYWLPVFGGWLRNVDDERMAASWEYVRRLAQRSEEIGYDITLIAELLLNDIKGIEAPSLDAWSTAAALAAVTERLELMVAVRPSFHPPAILAKQAANIDHISNGRLALNVVSRLVDRRGATLRRGVRRARRSLRAHARMARRRRRRMARAAVQLSRPLLRSRRHRARAEAGVAAERHGRRSTPAANRRRRRR